MTTITPLHSAVTRRTVLAGAAATAAATVAVTAGCGSDSGQSPSGQGSGPTSVAKADVPVGGGTVLTQSQTVVTQPSPGQFKAFSAVCTHQGCLVSQVQNGMIVCACHGSVFSAVDGSNVSGPAPTPLTAKTVTVEGNTLKIS
jgi:Rieske Fe-S protein